MNEEKERVFVRQVVLSDLGDCFAVESACYTTEGATQENIEKRIRMFPQGFMVAELGGRVIGLINSAATEKEDISKEALKDMVGHSVDGENIVIFSVAVQPDLQGEGYSTPLMNTFIEKMRGMGKKKILLICKQEFVFYYEKFGFYYKTQSVSTHGGFQWHEMGLNL